MLLWKKRAFLKLFNLVSVSSTNTALLVTNDLLMTNDAVMCSILVLFDLSAAFDMIDHSSLLDRLRQWVGISGTGKLDQILSFRQKFCV